MNVLHRLVRFTKSIYGELNYKIRGIKNNKIVLCSNFGTGYLCNPKYIAEALNRLYPGQYQLVLLIKNKTSLPSYIKQVKYGSFSACKELSTAHFWINNFRNDPKIVEKHDGQVYIQTWHGSLGPKRAEQDVEAHLSQEYISAAKYDGSITDLMFANNDLNERLFKNSFWYTGPVVRCGAPRNRPLLITGDDNAKKVRDHFGIGPEAKICLYAPTFRADGSMEAYRFDCDQVINALEKKFCTSFALLYRLHPNLRNSPRPSFLSNHIDATSYQDQQELLAASDIVISDYSSILEDFALTNKPAFIYATDLDTYTDDRGFYYPLSERPFPVATSSAELVKTIVEFDSQKYKRNVSSFFASKGLIDDGKGDEAIAEIIDGIARQKAN